MGNIGCGGLIESFGRFEGTMNYLWYHVLFGSEIQIKRVVV